MTVALIIIGIAVVCLVGYMVWLAEKKRREALAALAKRLSWFFIPGQDRWKRLPKNEPEVHRK